MRCPPPDALTSPVKKKKKRAPTSRRSPFQCFLPACCKPTEKDGRNLKVFTLSEYSECSLTRCDATAPPIGRHGEGWMCGIILIFTDYLLVNYGIVWRKEWCTVKAGRGEKEMKPNEYAVIKSWCVFFISILVCLCLNLCFWKWVKLGSFTYLTCFSWPWPTCNFNFDACWHSK